MRTIILICCLSLLSACASKHDKLLTQFEHKVEQYETLANDGVAYGDPQLDSLYNEIDVIMNELLSAPLSEAQTSRATQLSMRLQVAIVGIQEKNEPTFEIDLNQILQEIESNPSE